MQQCILLQEKRLGELAELRQKLEKGLRKGEEMARSLEGRMQALTKDDAHRDLIDLIVRMARLEAESMPRGTVCTKAIRIAETALKSDALLQELKMKRQENSLNKVHKFEQVANRLVSGTVDGRSKQC